MRETTIQAAATEDASGVPTAVVAAVAAAQNVDETALPSLYDVVDPDALETLCRHQQRSASDPACDVRFTFAGCEVAVDGSGAVRVTPTGSVEPFGDGTASSD